MTRKIAWTGTPREFDINEYGQRVVDHHVENRRQIPMMGKRKPIMCRIIEKSDGYSQQYIFGTKGGGKESFIQDMTEEDANRVLESDPDNFKDVTNDPGFVERFYRSFDVIAAEGLTQ
jgi:hypothetical protein